MSESEVAPRRVVIHDVAVLDGTGREPEGRVDVLVEDGVIVKAGSQTDAPAADAVVIDGAGCTLMAGLTDAHIHLALDRSPGRPWQRPLDHARPGSGPDDRGGAR